MGGEENPSPNEHKLIKVQLEKKNSHHKQHHSPPKPRQEFDYDDDDGSYDDDVDEEENQQTKLKSMKTKEAKNEKDYNDDEEDDYDELQTKKYEMPRDYKDFDASQTPSNYMQDDKKEVQNFARKFVKGRLNVRFGNFRFDGYKPDTAERKESISESGNGNEFGTSGSGDEDSATENNELLSGKNLPQVSQQGVQSDSNLMHTNSPISDRYPNFPVPPMIPLPVFYSSGDQESSGASGFNEVKTSKELSENVGESGDYAPRPRTVSSGDWVDKILAGKSTRLHFDFFRFFLHGLGDFISLYLGREMFLLNFQLY